MADTTEGVFENSDTLVNTICISWHGSNIMLKIKVLTTMKKDRKNCTHKIKTNKLPLIYRGRDFH
jgi:hypothetical protein